MIEVKFLAHSTEELRMVSRFMQELAEFREREAEVKLAEMQHHQANMLSNSVGSFGQKT